ncbi:hypothetical protein TWF191_008860 [Orbilia oligospora]|uniref:RBR-type E3 ubiquitin transferase n=1 Tax=Orbilia oligospora TaxID=2813651 RepID=A0A7C8UPJ0_ORBOL|nr:hypothetical protein TWF191_008860 [Orbilia oligospora]
MATAGPSRSRLPIRPRNPEPSNSTAGYEFNDDLLIALTLQLEELDIEVDNRKGKEKAGKMADRHAALQDYKDILLSMSQFHADQRMAKSIADAVLQDSATITEFQALEAIAVRDRQQALRMANTMDATPQTAPRPTAAATSSRSRALVMRGGDDYSNYDLESLTGSTEYGDQTTLYSEYDDYDELESNAGTTSTYRRPYARESSMKYYNAGPRVQCSICSESVLQDQSTKCNPCNHIYCRTCLRTYVFRAMKDESLYPLKCCKVEIPGNVIARILSAAEYEKYQEAAVEYSSSDRMYCPNKKCLQFIPPESVNKASNFAFCKHCSTVACTKCKERWHAGACRVDHELQAVINTAGQQGWKQCFKCKRMVELRSGCHHITCHCKAEFCYICGVEWKTCTCPVFEERRLYEDAAARVDQAAVRPLAPGFRMNMINQVQQQIINNNACQHPGGFVRESQPKPFGHRCEICDVRHWKYILACRSCGIEICEECRRFRA